MDVLQGGISAEAVRGTNVELEVRGVAVAMAIITVGRVSL